MHAQVSVQPSAKPRVIALVVQEETRDRNFTPIKPESERAEGRAGGRTGGRSGGWVLEHSCGPGGQAVGHSSDRAGGWVGRSTIWAGGLTSRRLRFNLKNTIVKRNMLIAPLRCSIVFVPYL